MEIMEPSSARISEPGRIRPSFRSASSRVVFAVLPGAEDADEGGAEDADVGMF
jgi:hypothetical protein